MAKNFISFCTLKTIDASTFAGAYIALNPLGTEGACAIIRIINDSNVPVTISFDGVTAHDYLRASSELQLTLQEANQPNGEVALLTKGTVVYAKAGAGVGFVSLAGYYQE
jgi:hypothetical protein